ncbi:MAG: glycoside hydrolase family 38 N-terminal domain-containing protein [Eubacteriales bacterium]
MDKQKYNIEDIREIHVIPYCHTDYAWTNIRSWHICRYIASYCEVLDIMRENPGFTWILDNVVHSLIPFLTYCPERFEEFKQRVREGRINIANGGWSLARPTQVGEETYIRNMAAADRKFRELFGEDIQIDCLFNADTAAGHQQLPQIIQSMGYKYYCFQRPETFLNKRGIPKQFRWYGIDDSDVIVSRGCYGGFFVGTYLEVNAGNNWEAKLEGYRQEELNEHLNLQPTAIMAQFQGCDDVLPLRNIYDQKIDLPGFIEKWNETQKAHMSFSTISRYFQALEKENIPEHRGILDPYDLSYNLPKKGSRSFWSMRYAGDRLLTELESISALCASNGGIYPYEEIGSLWLSLFEITGHAIEYTVDCDNIRLMNAFLGAYHSAEELLQKKCEELTLLVGTGTGAEHVLINTQGHTVTAFIPLHITSENGVRNFTLTDRKGSSIEYQITNVLGGDKPYSTFNYSSAEVIAKVTLPPFSTEIIKVKFTDEKLPVLIPEAKKYLETASPLIREINESFTVTTKAVTVIFKAGELVRLQNNADMNMSGGDKPLLRLHFTKTKQSNNWMFDFTPLDEFDFIPEKFEIIHNGPLFYRYRVTGKIAGSDAVMNYTVNDHDDTVYVDAEIDNRENNGIFIADFACEENTPVRADIPFGSQDLNPTEMVRGAEIYDPYGEVSLDGQFSAKSWFSYNRNFKMAVMHKDCSSYSRLRPDKNIISLILTQVMDIDIPEIEPTSMWVTQMDKSAFGCRGIQKFSFALTLDSGSVCELTRKAHNLRRSVRSARGYSATEKAPAESIFTADANASVIVTAFYRENDAYIIRFYECDSKDIMLNAVLSDHISKASKTNFTGRHTDDLHIDNGIISLPVKAYEIVTLKLYD